jgi:DNA-directed RNA polymerase specialized sigma24 family protein
VLTCHDHEGDRFASWLSRLQNESYRVLRRSRRPRGDHDDIVSVVVVEAWNLGSSLMDEYRVPEVYARVRTPHAAESFYRRERVQRGEGARLRRHIDGTVAAGRTVISFEAAPVESATTDDLEDRILDVAVARAEVGRVLRACAGQVRRADIETYVAVKAHEVPIVEVARRQGLARETVGRRVARVDRLLKAQARGFDPPV